MAGCWWPTRAATSSTRCRAREKPPGGTEATYWPRPDGRLSGPRAAARRPGWLCRRIAGRQLPVARAVGRLHLDRLWLAQRALAHHPERARASAADDALSGPDHGLRHQ